MSDREFEDLFAIYQADVQQGMLTANIKLDKVVRHVAGMLTQAESADPARVWMTVVGSQLACMLKAEDVSDLARAQHQLAVIGATAIMRLATEQVQA